jgi:hypothetical protein
VTGLYVPGRGSTCDLAQLSLIGKIALIAAWSGVRGCVTSVMLNARARPPEVTLT